MRQLSLVGLADAENDDGVSHITGRDEEPMAAVANNLLQDSFSHNQVCEEGARRALEARYGHLLTESKHFSRRLASAQGNRAVMLHNWIHYREGFSAQLVETLLAEFDIRAGQTILEPFAGSATSLLVAKARGIHATGIELLPICHLAWQAKSCVEAYDLAELHQILGWMGDVTPPAGKNQFPHLAITKGAFSPETAHDIMAYTDWLETLPVSQDAKILCRLLLVSILEQVSYTRKDGQYLRWDGRASKIISRNEVRESQGKKTSRGINKGILPTVQAALSAALVTVIKDIMELQRASFPPSEQRFLPGSSLELLPLLPAEQYDAVISSPPYCNRYDYTRTYALELAYIGVGETIFALRQEQLSCTVENRSKLKRLAAYYASIGAQERYSQIERIVSCNQVLAEVNAALAVRLARGEINNKGVLPMVANYFTELAFVYAELFRLCRPGAHVAFINDNVRYAGEIIPVDLLSTDLASAFGFEAVRVYVLPQRKGNSSQQMAKFGRAALRKSITVWRKPY